MARAEVDIRLNNSCGRVLVGVIAATSDATSLTVTPVLLDAITVPQASRTRYVYRRTFTVSNPNDLRVYVVDMATGRLLGQNDFMGGGGGGGLQGADVIEDVTAAGSTVAYSAPVTVNGCRGANSPIGQQLVALFNSGGTILPADIVTETEGYNWIFWIVIGVLVLIIILLLIAWWRAASKNQVAVVPAGQYGAPAPQAFGAVQPGVGGQFAQRRG